MLFHNHLFFICIFLFFLTINTWAFKKSSGFKLSWRNCGPSTDPIQLKSLTIKPDPIQVPGNSTIDSSVNIGSQIPTDVHVNVLLERKVGPFYVKVPCIDNFGSCSYSNACDLWAQYCPKYAAKYGLPCQCPIPADTYSVSGASIFIDVHPPPELLGEYRATADIASHDSHLGCVYLDLTIKN